MVFPINLYDSSIGQVDEIELGCEDLHVWQFA